jgi:hypothetical protein
LNFASALLHALSPAQGPASSDANPLTTVDCAASPVRGLRSRFDYRATFQRSGHPSLLQLMTCGGSFRAGVGMLHLKLMRDARAALFKTEQLNGETLKRAALSAESPLHRAKDTTAAVATIALPLANFSPGLPATIRSQRTAYVHLFLELTFLVPAHITSVALVRLDRRSSTGFAPGFASCWHNQASYDGLATRVKQSLLCHIFRAEK